MMMRLGEQMEVMMNICIGMWLYWNVVVPVAEANMIVQSTLNLGKIYFYKQNLSEIISFVLKTMT